MGEASADVGGIDVPDYVVGEQLGRGGFGDVFAARHVVLGREVAIKVLHAQYSRDPAAVARFVAEARAVNTIDHRAIVDVFDFGQLADGRQYYVMERIRGQTLRELLRARGKLTLGDALPILRGIAEAVDAAHGAGIAHRDLKPDNVFVTPDGGVKLIDFGLAKLTRSEEVPVTETGAVFGSPLYMSPEQCRGRGVDLATDAYAFGVVAYQLLTGDTPFRGDALAVALQHLNDPPPSSGQPPHVEATLRALLAKEPADRPRPLARAVEALAGEVTPRRRWPWVALAALVVAAAGVAAVIATRDDRPAPLRSPEVHWTLRQLTIRPDGLIGDPIFLDAGHLAYIDRSGLWSVDLSTGTLTDPVPTTIRDRGGRDGQPLVDGRWVFAEGDFDASFSERGKKVVLADPTTGTYRTLTDGAFPSPSPDGTRVALIQDGWLAVYDLRDDSLRKLVSAGADPVLTRPHWSRDGAWLAWGKYSNPPAERRVQLTRVSDGSTRPMPFASWSGSMHHPAVFLDDGRLAYCVGDQRGKQLRAHDPAHLTADEDVVLADLPATATACELDATTGNRVGVLIVLGVPNLGFLDLAQPVPEVKVVASLAPQILSEIDPVAHRAYVFTEGKLAPGLGTRFTGPPALRTHDIDNGVSKAAAVCPDDVGVVWRGDRIVHIALREDEVRFVAADTCALIEAWTLPTGTWSLPRCGPTDCFIARRALDLLELQRLAPGAREGSLLTRVDPGTTAFGPSLAVSPDGKWLAALAAGGGVVQIVSTSDGTATPHPMGGSPNSVVWSSDSTQLYVAGMLFDGQQYGLRSVALDGSMRLVWFSSDRLVFGLRADAGSRLVGNVTIRSMELWLLEP